MAYTIPSLTKELFAVDIHWEREMANTKQTACFYWELSLSQFLSLSLSFFLFRSYWVCLLALVLFLYFMCMWEGFFEIGFLCIGTHSVDQNGLELRHLPVSAFSVLGLKVYAITACCLCFFFFFFKWDKKKNNTVWGGSMKSWDRAKHGQRYCMKKVNSEI